MEQMCQTFILKLFPPTKEPRTFVSGGTAQPVIGLKPGSATLFVFMREPGVCTPLPHCHLSRPAFLQFPGEV